MSDFECPFCHSTKLRIPRKTQFGPEVELKENGEYGPVEDFCCGAQKKNHQYIKKNYHPDDAPNPEEVSKW